MDKSLFCDENKLHKLSFSIAQWHINENTQNEKLKAYYKQQLDKCVKYCENEQKRAEQEGEEQKKYIGGRIVYHSNKAKLWSNRSTNLFTCAGCGFAMICAIDGALSVRNVMRRQVPSSVPVDLGEIFPQQTK